MQLQIALDVDSLDKAKCLMEKVHPYVDIVEVGTVLGLVEGYRAVREMKRLYPDKLILSDAKIVDGGYRIASLALDEGADIVTALAITNNYNLEKVLAAAHERGKKAMVDTINCFNPVERVRELDEMGFDYILLHTPHETGASNSANIDDILNSRELIKSAKIGISGGINLDYIPQVVKACPDWVVVGSALTKSADPEADVKVFREYIV